MANEEKKPPPPPSHHSEQNIVVQVPHGASISVIEKQIHEALAQQPEDFLRKRKSRELVIVVQDEGDPY